MSDGEETTSIDPCCGGLPIQTHLPRLRRSVVGTEELCAADLPTGKLIPEERELHTEWEIEESVAEYPTEASNDFERRHSGLSDRLTAQRVGVQTEVRASGP